jgi:hypothetical protein
MKPTSIIALQIFLFIITRKPDQFHSHSSGAAHTTSKKFVEQNGGGGSDV